MKYDDLLRQVTDSFIGGIPPEQTVRELFVWVATDATGAEGIVAGILPGLGATPLVSSKRAAAERMEPAAREAQRRSIVAGQPVSIDLRRFVDTGLVVPAKPPQSR